MSTKEKYTKILAEMARINSSHLAYESKSTIKSGLKIIRELIDTRKDDGAELKKECDYIFVGALIAAMAITDNKHFWELRSHALLGTDAHFGDFLYPVDYEEVYKDSIDPSLTGLASYKYGLSFIGRRALERKELPFTGSFNPYCFPGLDSVFEAGHFDEYPLNTDPLTMRHPLTTQKNETKIQKQKRLATELTALESDLLAQLISACGRSSNKTIFSDLVKDVTTLTTNLKSKLQVNNATTNDIAEFKHEFNVILAKPNYQTAMNAHRGSLIWRGIMDALAKIETWVRQLPGLVSLPTFSLAAKDTFFSTKTAKVAEDVCGKVSQMTLIPARA